MRLLFKGRNRITSGYRLPERKDHNGLDIVGIDSRDILCPADGIVKSSTMITDRSNLTWQWGNYVRWMMNRDGGCSFAIWIPGPLLPGSG